MLVVDGIKHCTTNITYNVVPEGGVPPTYYLEGARDILDTPHSYHKIMYKSGKTRCFFNSKGVTAKVTKDRAEYYMASLANPTSALHSVGRYQEACLGLHMVVDDPTMPAMVCDCRAFYRGLLCSHVVVLKSLQQTLDLDSLLKTLSTNARRGRKRQLGPLERDNQDGRAGQGSQGGRAVRMRGRGAEVTVRGRARGRSASQPARVPATVTDGTVRGRGSQPVVARGRGRGSQPVVARVPTAVRGGAFRVRGRGRSASQPARAR